MSTDVEKQIDALLARMTLAEKVGQMVQVPISHPQLEDRIRRGGVGSVIYSGTPLPGTGPQDPVTAGRLNRLQRIAVEESPSRIPVLFGRDVIHGYKTVAPIPLGLAASWSPEVVEAVSRVAAREASADGIRWTFAPMLDIARDPRWGRIAEGFGEDPYLCATLARAAVRGFQGDDLRDPESILACAKHYVGYGAAEGGRDYNTVEITTATLRNVYLPSFHAAVQAGVGSIMSAFPEIGGVPVTAHRELLTDILKDEWGFDGFVVSDWAAVDELRYHGVAADRADAARLAAHAGVDMDMAADVYAEELVAVVESGALPEAVIDEAVRRILRAKFRLGLFEQPYTDEARASVHLSAEHLQTVRDAAARSLVLLKNDGILPLERDGDLTIGVFGPLADARRTLFGSWVLDGVEKAVVSVLDRVREKAGAGVTVRTAELWDDALKQAPRCDVVIAVMGEAISRSGEDNCVTTLDLPPGQQAFLDALHALQVPTVVVLLAGRSLALERVHQTANAILMAWHPGTEGAQAIADALFGDVNPSGKLPVTFPRTVGQVPLYYNHRPTGRPLPRDRRHTRYADQLDTPLYPFGYGLSYTEFEYRDLRVTPDGPTSVSVSAEVANVGDRAGDEIVQLYIRDCVASLSRPVKELKGFARVSLAPGESQTVTFRLTEAELGFYDARGQWTFEPGEFDVWIGPDSTRGLAGQFTISGA